MERTHIIPILATLAIAACGGGGSKPPQGTAPPPTYTVSGMVTGLTGTLVLRINDASEVSVGANGAVTLASALSNGANYSVAVKTQPSNPTQKCDLANASGTIAAANVSNVMVTCAAVPLTLTASNPANSATGVTRDAPLTLTFSTTLDPTTAVVTLTGPAGGVSATTQVTGPQLVVTPAAKLARLGAYTLNVAGMKGTGGELLAAPVSLAFTAADGSWSTPTAIVSDAGLTYWVRVAMDAHGNALVYFLQNTGVHYDLKANSFRVGTGWAATQLVEMNDLDDTFSPDMHFDPAGNALAVWTQRSSFGVSTWSNRYTGSDGTWDTAERIDTSSGTSLWPSLAFDGNGNALAVWTKLVSGAGPQLYFSGSARFTPGAGWSDGGAPTPVSDVFAPVVCFGAPGEGFAVWYQSGTTNSEIWMNVYRSGAWLTPTPLELSSTGAGELPQIACNPNGSATAVWQRLEAGIPRLHAAQISADGPTAAVTLDDGTGIEGPVLAGDGQGNAIVLWSQKEGTRRRLWSRHFASGRGWSPALRIDEAINRNSNDAQLALNARGDGFAVWRVASVSTPGQIWAARVTNGEFAPAQPIDPDSGVEAQLARVAIDPDGNATAVWMRCAGVCDVMASRFE